MKEVQNLETSRLSRFLAEKQKKLTKNFLTLSTSVYTKDRSLLFVAKEKLGHFKAHLSGDMTNTDKMEIKKVGFT